MIKSRSSVITLDKALPYLLIVAGVIGMFASFTLTYETIHVLTTASYVPSCNLNPILSCGSVMKTEQASLLGIPNSIFGLVAFSMLLTFGLLLLGGAKLHAWVWRGAQLAATLGVIFMHYLVIQAVFVIQTLCPWCLVIWAIVLPTFWYITLYNLRHHVIPLPARLSQCAAFIQKHHLAILIVWYAAIIALIGQHFWYFWVTLLP
jgi:uncharacterized membrane protein